MASTMAAIRSDPSLLSEVRRYGRFDLTGCYQCGSCTLACELVTENGAAGNASFPRRVIRYTQLGLRAPLRAGLEPWICHDCGDCSLQCPREADPRAAMATLRRFLSAQYDWTGISSRMLASRTAYLIGLVSMTLFGVALILLYHLFYVRLAWSDLTTAMGLEHAFPLMTWFTRTVILLPLVLLLSRGARMWWLTMHAGGFGRVPASIYVREAREYVVESVTQKMIRQCDDRSRWLGHWMLVFGVSLMLVIKATMLTWFQTENLYHWYHPQRLLGYLAAGLILYGVGGILVGRWRATKEFYRQTRLEDMTFPVLLVLSVLSGLVVHVARYTGFEFTSHCAYAFHVIIALPMLLVEMCFGKWSHMIYRPLALYFQAVKERAAASSAPATEVTHVV